MSFQAVRLKPFLSTTYHVKVAGLRAKLSWTTVVLCDHLYSRVDSSPKAGLIGHRHLASDELYRARTPRGAVALSGARQRNSLSYLEFQGWETRIDPTYSDILSLSSHKMYGPKGVGVVRVSRELRNKIEPLIYGGGQQDGLLSGTVPTPLCIGMAAAADLLAGDAAEKQRADLRRRRDAFIERLRGLAWPVAVNGPEGRANAIPTMPISASRGSARTTS